MAKMRSAFGWIPSATKKMTSPLTALYTTAGFVVLDVAAYQWHHLVGLCAIGLSCLIMGVLVEK
jgi:hypothetical protein